MQVGVGRIDRIDPYGGPGKGRQTVQFAFVPTLRRLTRQIAAELELGIKTQPIEQAAAVDRDQLAAVVDDGAVVGIGLESHQRAPQFGAQVVQ